ncbi:response regulator transcription factor [Rhodoplanes roseus]|uniref:DNA-binding response regulator n=1 Tax=Rhodoplanes roseus TaxID=29409 RepID=A0A327L4N8_9BRAD|nr:response regulator [Rhodoplanes roseus]RAI44482.1 DNA-binding response regulator [Rhodoplanes roseus]
MSGRAGAAPDRDGEAPLVFVVDDDVAVRGAVSSLLRSVGLRVEVFSSPQELLDGGTAERANCLVLDIRMPMVSGLDFQAQLERAGLHVPIVFLTGHGDIPMSVQAMKAGAVDFLAKPFRDQDLLDAVAAAADRDRRRRLDDEATRGQRDRWNSLSEREREVMVLATAGLMNKQIAFELGISEITVKIHRGRVMRKMAAHSFAHLVRMADSLGVRRDEPPGFSAK